MSNEIHEFNNGDLPTALQLVLPRLRLAFSRIWSSGAPLAAAMAFPAQELQENHLVHTPAVSIPIVARNRGIFSSVIWRNSFQIAKGRKIRRRKSQRVSEKIKWYIENVQNPCFILRKA